MQTLLHPPRTLMEVFKMLPEGTRAEIINGILYMSPAPSTDHQELVFTLTGQFYNLVQKKKNGKAFVSPIDVFLDSNNAFQPDLVFVLNQNTHIIKKKGIYGAPDLVIEILSLGTRKNDLIKKKIVYEKAGVNEYWIVDPSTKECFGFQLKKGEYTELKSGKGKIVSPLLKHTFKF